MASVIHIVFLLQTPLDWALGNNHTNRSHVSGGGSAPQGQALFPPASLLYWIPDTDLHTEKEAT